MESSILLNFGIVVIAAALLSYILLLLRQPPLLAYVAAGVIIGPSVLGYVTDETVIKIFAELGIAFLLFTVGMEMSFSKLKNIGLLSSAIGIFQVIITFAATYLIAGQMGFSGLEAIYIGLIITFSSTMVVIKLLSDNKTINTLHGRLVIGILLVQDIVAIFALSILSSQNFSIDLVTFSLLKGAALLSAGIILSKYGLPHIFEIAARSREQLFLSAVAVCMAFSIAAALFDFSIAIGAFIGGLALASTKYSASISERIAPIRDLFVALFFVTLGMQIVFLGIDHLIVPIILFFFIVIVLKPILITLICRLLDYSKRTSFMAGLSLAQISEFSLIIAGLGLSMGHLSKEIFSATVILAIATITITPYLFKYSNQFYSRLENFIEWTEDYKIWKIKDNIEEDPEEELKDHVIICGGHESSEELITHLQKIGERFIIIDFNPEIIKRLSKKNIQCIYGDATTLEILEKAGLKKAKIVVSTIPDFDETSLIIENVKKDGKTVIVTSRTVEEALRHYKEGADYVIVPKILSSEIMGTRLKWILKEQADIKKMREGSILKLKDIIKSN